MTEATNTAAPAGDDAAAKAAAEASAKAEKDAKKAAAKAEREAKAAAKKKEKEDAKAAKEKAKADAKQPSQNDITRPKADTVTGKCWASFDSISAKTGVPATIGDAIKDLPGTAEATVRTQYARWRKFHGITGRTEAKPAAPTEAAPPAAA
jgi:membrane protein involved in colicin uptake